MTNEGHFWQPMVILNRDIKVGFHKEMLAYPIYSPVVFSEPAQATEYIGQFIKDLVESTYKPFDFVGLCKVAKLDGEDGIIEQVNPACENLIGLINEKIIKGAIQEIIVGKIEREDI